MICVNIVILHMYTILGNHPISCTVMVDIAFVHMLTIYHRNVALVQKKKNMKALRTALNSVLLFSYLSRCSGPAWKLRYFTS